MSNTPFNAPLAEESSATIFTILKFFFGGIAQHLHQFFQVLGSFFSAGLGGFAASSELDKFNQAYTDKTTPQRATTLLTHLFGFTFNVLYAISILDTLVSGFGLSSFSIVLELITCFRLTSLKNAAKKQLDQAELLAAEEHARFLTTQWQDNLNTRLRGNTASLFLERAITARENYYKTRVELNYSRISVLSATLFAVGFFIQPVLFVAIGILLATKIAQFYDNKTNYQLSHGVIRLWDRYHPPKKSKLERRKINGSYLKVYADIALKEKRSMTPPTLGSPYAPKGNAYFNRSRKLPILLRPLPQGKRMRIGRP